MKIGVKNQNNFLLYRKPKDSEYKAIVEKITAWWSTKGDPTGG